VWQFQSSEKNKYRKPNPLYNNRLDRDTLTLRLSQIRETRKENDWLNESGGRRIPPIDQYEHQLEQQQGVKRKYQLV